MPERIITNRLDVTANGVINSAQLDGKLTAKLTATKGAAVTDVTGTAGATYTATEQALVNSTKTQLNALLASLRAAGIIS